MQYFLDSADLCQIAEILEKYPIDGVTTNPSIISRDLPANMSLAAKAGASFVAPYISHIDNLSLDGAQIASDMARLLRQNDTGTQILAASFRTTGQIERVISGGVTSVTVTAEMYSLLASHPGTSQELSVFGEKWNARFDCGIFDLLGGK